MADHEFRPAAANTGLNQPQENDADEASPLLPQHNPKVRGVGRRCPLLSLFIGAEVCFRGTSGIWALGVGGLILYKPFTLK